MAENDEIMEDVPTTIPELGEDHDEPIEEPVMEPIEDVEEPADNGVMTLPAMDSVTAAQGTGYTPTVWQDGADGGTPITAARLNNIEQGIVQNTAEVQTLRDSVSQTTSAVSNLDTLKTKGGTNRVQFDWTGSAFEIFISGTLVHSIKPVNWGK